jgi:hypothetical protein
MEEEKDLFFNGLTLFKLAEEGGELVIDGDSGFGEEEIGKLGLEGLSDLDDLLGSEHGVD